MAALVLSIGCYAQDMIVKKDGSIIQAKVSEIGTSEVKYKKWSNQDGPSYAIAKSEILAINYQNGDKDTFSDAQPITTQEPSEQNEPKLIERPVASNNLEVISRYIKNIGFKKTPSKIGKPVSRAVGVFAFSENSVLSNEDIEIEFAISNSTSPATTPIGILYYKKNEHLVFRYCIKIRNKTDKVLYFDLANCTRTNNKTGESYSFYDGETVSVSHGNTSGIGLGAGTSLGIIGVGTGFGTSTTNSTSRSYSQERIVSIPPHGMKIIRDFKLAKIKSEKVEIVARGEELYFGYSWPDKEIWGGIQYQQHSIAKDIVREGEVLNFSFAESPLVLEYIFTYSNVPDFSTYSVVKSNLYMRSLLGYEYSRTYIYNSWLNIKWNIKPFIENFSGYDENTILGPINIGN